MRKSVVATLVSLAGAASLVMNASVASAEANPPGCAKGYFCIYSGLNETGRLVVHTAGNWSAGSASFTGLSVFNNGVRYPGLDHVDLSYSIPADQTSFKRCIHYNPGPGTYKINFGEGILFKKVVWRGECP